MRNASPKRTLRDLSTELVTPKRFAGTRPDQVIVFEPMSAELLRQACDIAPVLCISVSKRFITFSPSDQKLEEE